MRSPLPRPGPCMRWRHAIEACDDGESFRCQKDDPEQKIARRGSEQDPHLPSGELWWIGSYSGELALHTKAWKALEGFLNLLKSAHPLRNSATSATRAACFGAGPHIPPRSRQYWPQDQQTWTQLKGPFENGAWPHLKEQQCVTVYVCIYIIVYIYIYIYMGTPYLFITSNSGWWWLVKGLFNKIWWWSCTGKPLTGCYG